MLDITFTLDQFSLVNNNYGAMLSYCVYFGIYYTQSLQTLRHFFVFLACIKFIRKKNHHTAILQLHLKWFGSKV